MPVFLIDGEEFNIENKKQGQNEFFATVNGKEINLKIVKDGGRWFVEKENVLIPVFFAKDERNNIYLNIGGEAFKIHKKTVGDEAGGEFGGILSGDIEPPMPGKVLKVLVNKGEKVEENQVLILMESMKLQVEVKAPFDGIVKEVKVSEGQTVNAGELIIKIEKNV